MDKLEDSPAANRKRSLKVDANTSPIEFDNNGGSSPLKLNRIESNARNTKIKEADFNENKEIVKQSRPIDEVKE